jgi:deoxyribodipyrimidine photo-lyase
VWALPATCDARAALAFRGGARAAGERIRGWVWERGCLASYKTTRNGLLGADYSSKLSPWLAAGCVSPRTVAAEVAAFEAARGANESTYWLLFELLWRDFFRFSARGWGNSLFHVWGPRRAVTPGRVWRDAPSLFAAWAGGGTGYPFVDANMRELAASGFMSNRGRQNVASFLTKDTGHDWRHGAEWFEALLLDASAPENWGNWTYVAGVGADPREDRYFLIPKQSREYDGGGDYMRHWLPELAALPAAALHTPEAGPARAAAAAAAAPPRPYPAPVVPLLAAAQGRPTEGHRYKHQGTGSAKRPGEGGSGRSGGGGAGGGSAPASGPPAAGGAGMHGGSGPGLQAQQPADGGSGGAAGSAGSAGVRGRGGRGRSRVQHLH